MKHFTADNFCSGFMGHLIGRTTSLKDRLLDRHLEPFGVTSSQLRVLIFLSEFTTLTPAELCRHSSLDSGSMTRMLDRLEHKALIVRSRSNVDRRQVQITLTAQGKRLAALMPDVVTDAMNDLFRSIESEELTILEAILIKMLVGADDQIVIERLAGVGPVA
jgi:MarR family transcriptional regulator, multiple antibiotic resistance protein MarR